MTTLPMLLVPRDVRREIEAAPVASGAFTLRWSEPDRCGVIVAAGVGAEALAPFPVEDHFLKSADSGPVGSWHLGDDEHVAIWRWFAGRGGAAEVSELRERLPGILWRVGVGVGYFVVVASTLSTGDHEWTAWLVNADGALPVSVDVERDDEGLSTLGDRWPTELLHSKHVAIVGVGSIGSVTASAIAAHGVGRLTLVDPDRLEFHNLVRHQLPRSEVGRNKAIALAETLERAYPALAATPLTKNVVSDTDAVRNSFLDADLIIGATDGVLPRRTIVHIARRLRKPALLGCVLVDGAIGEISRFRPTVHHGCLECRRRASPELFALDSSLDAPYGTGSAHLPMTAIGTDLALVGQLLAKSAVATLLEAAGRSDQRLPGEVAVIGLRPVGAIPPPYNVSRTGEVRWLPASPPVGGCPTCETPA